MKLTLEQNLDKDSPGMPIHSRTLSKKVGCGINMDIMDFSQTRTKSHKGLKARHGLNYVAKKGGDYALIITSGNAGPAFGIVSEDYDIQVVKFVNKNMVRKLINITELGQNKQGQGRYGITIRLPNKWFTPKKLQKFWKKLIKGKKRGYRNDSEFNRLIEVIEQRGLDAFNAFDVTNVRDYCKKGNPYLIPEIKKAVKKYDYIFVPLGSGELFSGFQEAAKKLWFSKPVLVGVTSNKNPLSLAQQKKSGGGFRIRKKHRKSHADKLDTPKIGRGHIRNVSLANKKTYFCGLKDKLIDKAYDSMDLVRKEHGNLQTTKTGSICLGVLNKENVYYFGERDGIEVQNTYGFTEKPITFYKKQLVEKPLIIKPKSKILVVNTGGLS